MLPVRSKLKGPLLSAVVLAALTYNVAAFEITRGGTIFENGTPVDLTGRISFYDFFGRDPQLPTARSEVASRAFDLALRSGRIQDGDSFISFTERDPRPGDSDVDGEFTDVPGRLVGMSSFLGAPQPAIPTEQRAARAKTDYFANHAYAATPKEFFFYSDTNVLEINDDGDPSNDTFVNNTSIASADSRWGDTRLATQNARVKLDFGLDGSVFRSSFCEDQLCNIIIPPSTNSFFTSAANFSFEANMAVFDLSVIAPCLGENCDGEPAAPITLRSISVRGGLGFDEEDMPLVLGGDTLDINFVDSLEFDIVTGHEYYVVSELKVRSQNGVVVDLFNTLGMTAVHAPPGSFISDAVLNKGAIENLQPVPLPGANWLMLGGLSCLALRRRVRPC